MIFDMRSKNLEISEKSQTDLYFKTEGGTN